MIRRAIGTTLAGLCALTGPLATSALATTAPTLTSSVSSARQGIPFTVNGGSSCPSDSGLQSVQFSFTDSAGLIYPVGEVDTDDNGAWADASIALPVAGVNADGSWEDNGTATGAGQLNAICVAPGDSADDPGDDSGNADDPGSDDSTDPGDDSSTDPGDDSGDGGDSADVTTLTYAPAALTVVGSAPQFTVSAIGANHTVTVTPSEACFGTGAATVDVAVVGVGDDNASDDALVAGSATSTDSGAWTPVTLTLPGDATGDYAVTAVCSRGDVVTSTYDTQSLALGTVSLGKPVCTAKGALAKVGGTYSGTILAGPKSLQKGLVKLNGEGPWKVSLRSSETGRLLLSQTVSCAAPMFNLDVSKTGVTSKGQIRASVCNTGRGDVTALLQVVNGKRGETVDQEAVSAGDCTVLIGGKLRRGDDVKARVVADQPGDGSSVEATFTVHRGKH